MLSMCVDLYKCICLSPCTLIICFELKLFADFKHVPMVSHVSCFQLSDEFLFAELRLSNAVSPPLCLSPAPAPASTFFCRAGLVEQITYSFLSRRSLPVPGGTREMEKHRERRRHKAFLLSCNGTGWKQMDGRFSEQNHGSPNTLSLTRNKLVSYLNVTSPALHLHKHVGTSAYNERLLYNSKNHNTVCFCWTF